MECGARLQRMSTPHYTPERQFAPINPDGGFSSIEDVALSDSEEERPSSSELGATAPRSQEPYQRSAKGVKRELVQPHPLRQGDLSGLEKRFAALSLKLSASSDRSLLEFGDFGDFTSPSSKALSKDSTRAHTSSYTLSADNVTSAHNLWCHSNSKQGKKYARAAKKRRGAQTH